MTIYFGSSTDEDLIAELEQRGYFCAKAQEPVARVNAYDVNTLDWLDMGGTLGCGTALFAAPIPPVREPLAWKACIDEARKVYCDYLDVREALNYLEQVFIAAAIKEQPKC